MTTNVIYNEDCLTGLKKLPDQSIDCCITSPPYYGLRDYGHSDQIGLEDSPDEYVSKIIEVFTEVKRVLKKEGTLWLNLGDSYTASGSGNGLKPKDLIGIPWMVAFALRQSGWYLRQDIIWSKPNPMPESVTDRCTKSHEYIFLLSKSSKYYYDAVSIQEAANYDGRNYTMMKGSEKYSVATMPGSNPIQSMALNGHERWNKNDAGEYIRNKRSVWTVTTRPYSQAHFATFPERLVVDMIKAGCPENGIVLDPFTGAGTSALVARKLNRQYIGFELNEGYVKIAVERLRIGLGFFQ